MRRLWGLAGGLGLLAMVVFGTWGCLAASVKDPSAPTSALIAVGGAIVMVIGVVGRGDSSRVVAKSRRVLGGIGLVVAPVAGVLSLLQLGTEPSKAGGFLLLTLAAFALWAQGMAVQPGLSFRASLAWLALGLLFAAIALPIVAFIGAIVVAAMARLEWLPDGASRLGFAAGLAVVAASLTVWAANRRDRQAVFGAVWRAALGRAAPGDIEVLAAGPGPILRRQPPRTAELQERDARLAALDRRVGPPVGGGTGTTPAGDDTHTGDD